MAYLHSAPLPIQILFGLVSAQILAIAAGRLLGLRQTWLRNIATGLSGLVAGGVLSWYLTSRQPGVPPDGVVFVALTLLATMLFVVGSELAWPSRPFDAGSGPAAPHPIRAIRRRLDRSRRYLELSVIATRYGFGSVVGRSGSGGSSGAAVGRNLSKALNEAGGVFIKLGQFLSTRPDIVPEAIAIELSTLQDHADTVPTDLIRSVIREDLGEPEDVFAEFDPNPVASASIAQVHRARLKDGRRVAVKVQKPDIAERVHRDIDVMLELVGSIERRSATARHFRAIEMVNGFADSLRRELDFRNEAQNMSAVRHSEGEAPLVVIPRAELGLVTSRVLTMEWLGGARLADSDRLIEDLKLDRREMARRLLNSIVRQVIVDGVFHADPHPGNVQVLSDGRLALLDFGSVGRLDGGQLETFQLLIHAIQRKDSLLFSDCMLQLAYPVAPAVEDRFQRSMTRFMVESLNTNGSKPETIAELLSIVQKSAVGFPPEVAAVFRCLLLVEGTLRSIDPTFDITSEVQDKDRARQLAEVLDASSASKVLGDQLVALLPLIRKMPRRIDRITNALESGRFVTVVKLGTDEALDHRINRLADRFVMAFVGPSLGLVSVMVLALPASPSLTPGVTLSELIGYGGLCISAGLILRVIADLIRHPVQ